MPMVSRTEYERPKNGQYIGVIADVVELGKQPDMTGKLVEKIRIVWLLNVNDSQGRPLSTIDICTLTNGKKSKLRQIAKAVLGTDPPKEYNTDVLIGRSKKVFIQVVPSEKTGEPFPKIVGIVDLEPGEQPMAVPADFKREVANKPFANQASGNASMLAQGTGAAPQASQPVPLTAPAATVNPNPPGF